MHPLFEDPAYVRLIRKRRHVIARCEQYHKALLALTRRTRLCGKRKRRWSKWLSAWTKLSRQITRHEDRWLAERERTKRR